MLGRFAKRFSKMTCGLHEMRSQTGGHTHPWRSQWLAGFRRVGSLSGAEWEIIRVNRHGESKKLYFISATRNALCEGSSSCKRGRREGSGIAPPNHLPELSTRVHVPPARTVRCKRVHAMAACPLGTNRPPASIPQERISTVATQPSRRRLPADPFPLTHTENSIVGRGTTIRPPPRTQLCMCHSMLAGLSDLAAILWIAAWVK